MLNFILRAKQNGKAAKQFFASPVVTEILKAVGSL